MLKKIFSLFAFSFFSFQTISACSTCKEDQCTHFDVPEHPKTIHSGILGYAQWYDDLNINGCQACQDGTTQLYIWKAEQPVSNSTHATSIIEEDTTPLKLNVHGRYEQHLDWGNYLICALPLSTEGTSCITITLDDNSIFMLNISLISPLPLLWGYDPEGSLLPLETKLCVTFRNPDTKQPPDPTRVRCPDAPLNF